MAAYAALLSLAQTTHLNTYQHQSLFSSEAEEKVRSIHDYVNFLLLFFDDFPQKVNRWEGRIRDVAYEIEDIIEVFICQRIQRHPPYIKLEGQLENVMEEIGLIAGEVMEERPAYIPASSSSSRLESTGNDAVIGLDDDITAIKERLCGQSPNLRVVPIVGMGGIGKTTLAKAVYDDQLIIEHFDIRAWVVASQDYSPHRFRKILLNSMKLLEDQMSADAIDESDTELIVYKKLKGWRYLIVIDDVWGTNIWDDVKYMFPDDKNGSRVMLTTRQLDVASYPDTAGPLHDMRFMNCSQSWDLLRLKVFTDGYCTPDLEDVGTEIARRCAGLPLAVVLVAGVLSLVSKTKASWEEIAKNVNPVIGLELEEILSLSYTYLPHHLRLCFLFIGGFLEDASIHASRLVRLWVAEGFLKHGGSKSLEEEAEECLEDLVKRNLVIVSSRKTNGKIKSCSLHDMVRDLCIRIAREEKFLHVLDGCDLPQGLMNERRISFSRSDIDKIWGPTFRTILCFQMKIFPSWLALLGSYKLLRVLDALHVNLKELPSEVFDLHFLRYLALMGSFSIPYAVSNLVNLQTLIIHLEFGKLQGRYDDGIRHSLPLEIWRLPQLRHLFFHAPYMLRHPLFAKHLLPLENLQTLLLVENLVWDEKILQLIPNVKRLGLTYSSNQEHHLHRLKDLHQLEKLKVIGYQHFSWRGQNPTFPCALKKLTLVGGGFPWKDMAIVGSLPNLEILKLLGNACDGETWETTDEDFPRLKFLVIDESHLREWITHSNPFPLLKHLVLRSCWNLREIPEGIGEIPTLELIEVDFCTNSLVESAKKIKEDQESYGNYGLQVVADHEVRVPPSLNNFKSYLKHTRLEFMGGPRMSAAMDLFQNAKDRSFVPLKDLKLSDFDSRDQFWIRFPSEGSKITPPHQSAEFRWKDYNPVVFRHLRQLFQIDPADYMLAICGDDAWRELSSPGKSGSFFYLTQDDRFMIKTVKKSEVKVLIKMLPSYYQHVCRYENSLVTKFYGVHCVKPVGGVKKRFIVMGNLFCSEYRIHRRFDLKGSSHGRTTDKLKGDIDETTTLKDLDLNYVFRLQTNWYQELIKQIDRDCEFLETERIMDYSLLVGLHFRDVSTGDKIGLSPFLLRTGKSDSYKNEKFMRGCRFLEAELQDMDRVLSGRKPLIRLGANMPARAERAACRSVDQYTPRGLSSLTSSRSGEIYEVVLYFGIIDILQDYDITKKLEHAYKSLQVDPTSISAVDPKLYSKRFRDFVGRIFIEDR